MRHYYVPGSTLSTLYTSGHCNLTFNAWYGDDYCIHLCGGRQGSLRIYPVCLGCQCIGAWGGTWIQTQMLHLNHHSLLPLSLHLCSLANEGRWVTAFTWLSGCQQHAGNYSVYFLGSLQGLHSRTDNKWQCFSELLTTRSCPWCFRGINSWNPHNYYCYHPSLMDAETEAQRGEVISHRSQRSHQPE
jgi:hypothetical protein